MMRSFMRSTCTVFTLAALGACAGASGGSAAAAPTPEQLAAIALESPCGVNVPEQFGPWRSVQATGFTFCVPAAWNVSGERATYPGGTLRWGIMQMQRVSVVSGGSGGISATSIANAGGSRSNTDLSRVQRFSEVIGGQMASLFREEGTGRLRTGVSFPDERISITGEASGEANVNLQLIVFRTVRFTR